MHICSRLQNIGRNEPVLVLLIINIIIRKCFPLIVFLKKRPLTQFGVGSNLWVADVLDRVGHGFLLNHLRFELSQSLLFIKLFH